MKKTIFIVALLLFLVCVVTSIGVVVRREILACDVQSLVWAEGEMPEGWEEAWKAEPPALDRMGAGQVYKVFMQSGDETAYHTVYEYSNRTLAALHIFVDNEVFFPSVGWNWGEMDDTGNQHLCADQHKIRCGHSNDPYLSDRCTAVLRYGPYISDFSSSVQGGFMSKVEFKRIVLRIDARLCHCKK